MPQIAFTSPALLWALGLLPLLWLLLRAVPPAPLRLRFPAVALLLGLRERDKQADKTPWWLLLLRALALAGLIIGFAGPVLNPDPIASSQRPLLIAFDATWADAPDWTARQARAAEILAQAAQDGRPVALVALSSEAEPLSFLSAEAQQGRLAALQPAAWLGDDLAAWGEHLPEGDFDTIWFSDGLAGRGKSELATLLAAKGDLQLVQSNRPLYALSPARYDEGLIHLRLDRLPAGGEAEREVILRGLDPAGVERDLAHEVFRFRANDLSASVTFDLPPEMRNRITRFELAAERSAAAVSLSDDSLKRRKVALVTSGAAAEGLQLLSGQHYLRQALAPSSDLIEGALEDVLKAAPDVVVLVDVPWFSWLEEEALRPWLEKGGLLLRFAGPRMASGQGDPSYEDPFLPVALRRGGRQVGGALSWGEPKTLAPFGAESPFYGLGLPEDLAVKQQVLAEPDPELAQRTLAALQDGTPLVTRRAFGQGQVVLFHVSANAEWSNLPLMGLFVQMLERLNLSSAAQVEKAAVEGQVWQADRLLDAWGVLREGGSQSGLAGEDFAAALQNGPSAKVPAGLYAGRDRRVALNVISEDFTLQAAQFPRGTKIVPLREVPAKPLQGPILAIALGLLLADIFAALALSGCLLALVLLALVAAPRAEADETDEARAIAATSGVVFAYIETGDPAIDEISHEGLKGLGDMLRYRTAVEPMEPMAVDLEVDEITFYPFLYWPITAEAETPSAGAYAKLNQFLRTGGLILFDTRDGDLASAGVATPEAEALKQVTRGLDIPPLEILPEDHVLTRSFYLLQDFPGRQSGAPLWVEAAPEIEAEEDMPFRSLNDGVTPVVIGGNDWASAWAMDRNGVGLLPMSGGMGERQREFAYRFGINLIMHVLTGNYKSDQVHVPALLERLGEE